MKEKLKILYIEDEQDARTKLVELLQSDIIGDYEIEITGTEDFNIPAEKIRNYQIVILDIYKGKPGDKGNAFGEEVLTKIQQVFFVPVIFYSGNIESVQHLRSQIVGVATKGDGGIDELKSEIERITKHNLPFLKGRVHAYIESEFKKYFWEVIQKENKKFSPDADDFSLGYMLLRNFADSLSKESIKNIMGDDTISPDKVHPMEFYIYPTNLTKEYECGEIISNGDDVYVILTPSCDFVSGNGRKRKVDYVVLLKTTLLIESKEYKNYSDSKKELDSFRQCKNQNEEEIKKKEITFRKHRDSLSQFINSGKSDRFFFLPETPFIQNRVIDFQNKVIISYNSLINDYKRIAKLDNPFAQSMATSYARYYNRIGFPDIDSEFVISHLSL